MNISYYKGHNIFLKMNSYIKLDRSTVRLFETNFQFAYVSQMNVFLNCYLFPRKKKNISEFQKVYKHFFFLNKLSTDSNSHHKSITTNVAVSRIYSGTYH